MSRFWWVATALVALLSIIMRHNLLLLMSILMALLAAAAHFWARHCLTNVTYVRRFESTHLFFGRATDLHLEITNAKLLPLSWLRVDDEFPVALAIGDISNADWLSAQEEQVEKPETHKRPIGTRHSLINVLSMRWYERITRRYRIRGLQRGAWKIGPAQMRSGDIFGFDIRRMGIDAHPQRVIVYPLMMPISALDLPARHPFGDFRTQRRLAEDPLRLMGTREYNQGDSFRHIHWKATARRQALQTKVFEPSSTRPLALFLDIRISGQHYWGHDSQLREYAISATASIARHEWEEGYAVGLYSNALLVGDQWRLRIPPRKHAGQMVELLEALARIEGNGRWPIEQLLQTESRRLPYGATAVVITTHLSPTLLQTVADLQRRGYGMALVVLGEEKLEQALLGVHYYHIGGHERWQAFQHAAQKGVHHETLALA